MSRLLSILFFLTLLASPAQAVISVTLAWEPVTNANAAGYNVYWGNASHSYTNHVFVSGGLSTNATVIGLADSHYYYFAATTVATNGLESPYSDEVIWWNGPGAPTILTPWVQLQWQPSVKAQIQASADLLNWQCVGTSTNGAAGDLISNSNRFYRTAASVNTTLKINRAPAP